MRLIYILIITLTIQTKYCYSVPLNSDTINAKPEKLSISTRERDTLSESQAYKLLYENQVKANDSILKTIFYALGGLATAILAVFASNWWFNEKKVKDIVNGIDSQISESQKTILLTVTEKINAFTIDKITEINQTQAKLQEEVTISLTNVNKSLTQFTEGLRKEMRETNESLLSNYQKQLDSFNENYRQQINSLTDSYSQQTKIIGDQFNSEKSDRLYNENQLKQRLARVEFYMWEGNNVYTNALGALLTELDLKLQNPVHLQGVYDINLEQISYCLDRIPKLDKKQKEEIVRLFEKLPTEYEIQKGKILAIVFSMKTD